MQVWSAFWKSERRSSEHGNHLLSKIIEFLFTFSFTMAYQQQCNLYSCSCISGLNMEKKISCRRNQTVASHIILWFMNNYRTIKKYFICCFFMLVIVIFIWCINAFLQLYRCVFFLSSSSSLEQKHMPDVGDRWQSNFHCGCFVIYKWRRIF